MHYRPSHIHARRSLALLGAISLGLSPGIGRADEPGIFARFFRGVSNSPAPRPKTPAPRPAGPALDRSPTVLAPTSAISRFDGSTVPGPTHGGGGVPVSTPQPEAPVDSEALPKLTPKSRVNRPITTADPILARFALGRSNDGGQFAMFMEIFADGTVLDSEGVHRVRQADLNPVVEAIQNADFSRIRGHSGAPPTDFIDHVQIIVFDRRLGRLTAHPFSYSGNPQGSDHAVRHLHAALETLQLKLSQARSPIAEAPPAAPDAGAAAPASDPLSSAPSTGAAAPIDLTSPAAPGETPALAAPTQPRPSIGPAASAATGTGIGTSAFPLPTRTTAR